jgi:hypothetical protein
LGLGVGLGLGLGFRVKTHAHASSPGSVSSTSFSAITANFSSSIALTSWASRYMGNLDIGRKEEKKKGKGTGQNDMRSDRGE